MISETQQRQCTAIAVSASHTNRDGQSVEFSRDRNDLYIKHKTPVEKPLCCHSATRGAQQVIERNKA